MGILSAPWKIATLGAGVVAAILGFLLFTSHLENKSLVAERDRLVLRIEDPKTGFIARLTQANANVVTLQGAVKSQNEKIAAAGVKAEADRQQLERLRKELALAQAETAKMQTRLNQFMATKPQGNSLSERITDIDGRILKDLKR